MRISDARAVRLLWMVENRFTYLGRRFHEIGFYWLLDVPGRSWAEQSWPDHGDEFEMSEPRIIFRWARLSDLGRIVIKPGFLRHGLAALPAAPTYLQVDE